jgi:acyl dehydratase
VQQRMPDGDKLHHEDLAVGKPYSFGRKAITAEEIVAFGRAFDPQPMHTDPEAAKATPVGGLIASGWHTCAIMMRLLADGLLGRVASLGSPGVDEVRWLKPVRPGDTLSAWVECAAKMPSKSRPEMGVVHEHWHATNQKGELVMTLKGVNMVRRRPA